ncbi:MAG: outer membrane protein [Candidatus Eisenbacteria bacterium]
MIRPLLLFVACIFVGILAGDAVAQSDLLGPSRRSGYWDFGVQTRYVGSHDYDSKGGSHLSLEDDLGWGFNVGYSFKEWLNVGALFSWRTVDYSAKVVNSEKPDDIIRYSSWLDTATIAVNATWNVLPNRLTPYVQGAGGVAMVDTNIPASIDMDCWYDPWWGYTCLGYASTYGDDGSSFSVGAGMSWQLTKAFFVRAGYEKTWIDVGPADDFDIIRLDLAFLYR